MNAEVGGHVGSGFLPSAFILLPYPSPMFDNLKGIAGLPGMMGKFGEMKGRLGDVQKRIDDELGQVRAEADAGGGMVAATCNGRSELVRVKIDANRLDPSKAKPEDLELLEDLIVAAVAAAQVKARDQAADVSRREMSRAAEEMGLPPGLLDQLGKAGG